MDSNYSVSELTAYIRDLFAYSDRMQNLWVTGEVSNMTRAASGHWYFTIKDDKAQLKCVMWRSSAEKQSTVPRNGDAVLVHGYIGVYEATGVYQLYADRVRPVGVGDLYAQFEQLKTRLEAEGLFDSERKRPIPLFPRQIGVVTSADAAAFQDVQNVLRRRFPLAEVILSATLVQGESAPPQICAALERINRTNVDIIILCRGGGSIEELWAFNDERVARAIADSRIPVISGVGHETDFTIADFVADLRAPTPSAAAELATPDIDELRMRLRDTNARLSGAMDDHLSILRDNLSGIQRTMRHVSPLGTIHNLRQRIDDWNGRLAASERGRLSRLRERLAAREAALNAANPEAILARGYAIITTEEGRHVTSADQVTTGDAVNIQLRDGRLQAKIQD